MGKIPYFNFFPDDWLSDEKLRACSSAAQGLWMDILCLMHKNDRRGFLLLNGNPLSAQQLARLSGRSTEEVQIQLGELINAGVPSVSDTGALYSRRMVRDEKKRLAFVEAGRKGGRPKKGSGKGMDNPLETPPLRVSMEMEMGIGNEFFSERGSGGKPKIDGGSEVRGEISPIPRHERAPDSSSDGPTGGETWSSYLTVLWCFHFAGVAPSQRDWYQLDKFFGSLLDRGIKGEAIRDRIREPARTKSEPTWEFEKHWAPAKGRSPKIDGGEMQRRLREEGKCKMPNGTNGHASIPISSNYIPPKTRA